MNIELLEKSFGQVSGRAVAFSASFYEALFQHYPELEPMFAEVSLEAQEKKLIFSLAAIVENLRNPDVTRRALLSLGARHVQVGTLRSHYPMVGQALIETFETYLGEDWTPEVAAAWLSAYDAIASIMLEGARHPEAYLEPELTFYDWIDLYGEGSSKVKRAIADLTDYHYRRAASSAG